MSTRIFTAPESEKLKREAKKLRKRDAISHVEALDRIAVREGFESWWHLQHQSKMNTKSPSPGAVRPIVRFVMDPKHTDELDDEILASRGFARDEEFTEKLAELSDPDEPWEAAAWISAFRFIDWPSDDFAEILKRIEDVFYFLPDEIWIGDKKVPEQEWRGKSPSWVVIRDRSEQALSPAESIVEGLLPELAAMLTHGNPRVVSAMAETNAQPFEFDTGEVESAKFVNGEDRIDFTASILLVGEQDDDGVFAGDEIDLTVKGIAVRTGSKWTFAETNVEHLETNA